MTYTVRRTRPFALLLALPLAVALLAPAPAGAAPAGAGEPLYDSAYELYQEGRYADAADAFARAAEAGFRPGDALYNAACSASLAGRTEAAIELLDRSLAAGFRNLEQLTGDTDLDPLRAEPRFQRLVDGAFSAAGVARRAEDRPLEHTLERYRRARREETADGETWQELGTRLLTLGEIEEAIDALSTAVDRLGAEGSLAMYNLACAHSRAGDASAALHWLDRAVEAGFSGREHLLRDPDLRLAREEPAFAGIVERSDLLDLGRFRSGDEGGSAYSEARWRPAVALYRDYVRSHPESGRGWFNLGWSLHFSSRFPEAIDAFRRAFDLGFLPSVSAYNVGAAHARLGQTETAFAWLSRAIDRGFGDASHLEQDPDLERLRAHARYGDLLRRVKASEG